MPEVPEHLLKRSRERRKALGLPVEGEDGDDATTPPDFRSLQHPVPHRIGVDHHPAASPQAGGHLALAAADSPGQADHGDRAVLEPAGACRKW